MAQILLILGFAGVLVAVFQAVSLFRDRRADRLAYDALARDQHEVKTDSEPILSQTKADLAAHAETLRQAGWDVTLTDDGAGLLARGPRRSAA